MITPIIDIIFRVLPVIRSARSTPTRERGSESMIARGCMNDSNCDARIRKIRITARISASTTYPAVSSIDSVSPPRETERSEEHTSELQSRGHLVCRLLLEKKNKNKDTESLQTT